MPKELNNKFLCVAAVPPKVVMHYDKPAQAVSRSERVILDCPVDGGDPPPSITWFKKDVRVEINERIHQFANGSIAIYDVGVRQ